MPIPLAMSLERKASVDMLRYVDKIRVPVRVALRGEQPVEGCLSLSPQAELHEGPETILERMNEISHFVPFIRASGSTCLLLTRRHIEYVEAGHDVDVALVRPQAFRTTREERVTVRLLGGASFDGVIAMEQPDDFNRTSDYLNSDEDFFPLLMSAGTLLVNKWRVLDVCVHESGAAREPRAA